MNYTDTLDYLFNRLPMFQRSGPIAYKNNLDNTLLLDKNYGSPHKKFKSIHVAGTNGKGSVSHMLAAILQKAGFKTGLYTSPHLKDFRERIRINGQMISENEVVQWVEKYRMNNKLWKIEPSFFELTVCMAFDYFASENVDVAIIEVGLGGRLDSTNIIRPEISVITNIGLDHTALLGDSLEKIATEKAGIIKKETPVVIGTIQTETENIFREKAKQCNSDIYFAEKEFLVEYSTLNLEGKQLVAVKNRNSESRLNYQLDLLGNYQHKNLPAVLKTIQLLQLKNWKITETSIFEGLANVTNLTGLKGRWQVIGSNPRIICDTGHNFEGIKQVVEQIENTPYKSLHIVFGMVNDKEPNKILELLPQKATYYFTKANIPRAFNEEELRQKAFAFGLQGNSYFAVSEAFAEAKKNAGKDDFIFVGGSTFIVAEIL